MSHNELNSGIAKKLITSLLMFFVFFVSLSAQADRLQSTGELTLLRVHEVGSKFGPRADQIDVEVVVKISSEPNRSFGFTLREDSKLPAHTGMLNILRDAFNYNHNVTLVYDIDLTENDVNAPNKNGTLIRAWVTKAKNITKLKKFDPMVLGTMDKPDDIFTVFLKIKCTKRGADGRCNQATCERERDPNSPTGYELQSCALFTLGCDSNGHNSSGDGRNNSTCTRAAQ